MKEIAFLLFWFVMLGTVYGGMTLAVLVATGLRPRFSLRLLLIVTTLACLIFGLLAYALHDGTSDASYFYGRSTNSVANPSFRSLTVLGLGVCHSSRVI